MAPPPRLEIVFCASKSYFFNQTAEYDFAAGSSPRSVRCAADCPPRRANKMGKKDAKGEDDEENVKDENEGKQNKLAMQILAFVDGTAVSIYMIVLTILSLWGDDFRLLTEGKEYDFIFTTGFNSVAFTSFFAEFIANSIVKEGYKWGFFFWLDMIAVLSMIQDQKILMAMFRFLLRMSDMQIVGGDGLGLGNQARLARLHSYTVLLLLTPNKVLKKTENRILLIDNVSG